MLEKTISPFAEIKEARSMASHPPGTEQRHAALAPRRPGREYVHSPPEEQRTLR